MTISGVAVKLDRPRELRYGVNALVLLEEKLGKQLAEILSQGMGVGMLRMVFWAGLVWDDKELDEDGAGVLMDLYMDEGHEFQEVTDLITKALMKSGFVDAATVKAIEDAVEKRDGEDQEGEDQEGEEGPLV